jgi:hypothetical protein
MGECVCDLGTKAEAVVAAHSREIASVENRGMVMNECSDLLAVVYPGVYLV